MASPIIKTVKFLSWKKQTNTDKNIKVFHKHNVLERSFVRRFLKFFFLDPSSIFQT